MSRKWPWGIAAIVLFGCGRLGFDQSEATGDAGLPDAQANSDASSAPFDATGFWVVETALIPGEATARTRDDTVGGIRADILINEVESTVVSRQVLLTSSVPQGQPSAAVGTFTHEQSPERWVMSTSAMASVYEPTVISPSVVELTMDFDDPRNTGGLPPTMRLSRSERPVVVFEQEMTLVEVLFPGEEETPADACVATPAGAVRYSGTIEELANGLSRSTITTQRYGDLDCLDIVSTFVDDRVGFGELDGTIARSWSSATGEESDPLFIEYELTLQGDNVRLDRTDCEPAPGCSEELFSRLIFGPNTE